MISHFPMNNIMAKTCSIAKVNPVKCHNFSNPAKYLPTKISGHMVWYIERDAVTYGYQMYNPLNNEQLDSTQ